MALESWLMLSAALSCVLFLFESLLLKKLWRKLLAEKKIPFQLGLHETWTSLLIAAAALYLVIDIWKIHHLVWMRLPDWVGVILVALVFWSIVNGVGAAVLFHRRHFSKQDFADSPLMILVGGLSGILQVELIGSAMEVFRKGF